MSLIGGSGWCLLNAERQPRRVSAQEVVPAREGSLSQELHPKGSGKCSEAQPGP